MISHVLPLTCIAPQHIKDRNDIVAVLKFLIQVIGIDYHPSKAWSSYWEEKTDKPCFDEYQAKAGERINERLMQVCSEQGISLIDILCEVSPACNPIKLLITVEVGSIRKVESNYQHIDCQIVDMDIFNVNAAEEFKICSEKTEFRKKGDFHNAPDNHLVNHLLKEIGF